MMIQSSRTSRQQRSSQIFVAAPWDRMVRSFPYCCRSPISVAVSAIRRSFSCASLIVAERFGDCISRENRCACFGRYAHLHMHVVEVVFPGHRIECDHCVLQGSIRWCAFLKNPGNYACHYLHPNCIAALSISPGVSSVVRACCQLSACITTD